MEMYWMDGIIWGQIYYVRAVRIDNQLGLAATSWVYKYGLSVGPHIDLPVTRPVYRSDIIIMGPGKAEKKELHYVLCILERHPDNMTAVKFLSHPRILRVFRKECQLLLKDPKVDCQPHPCGVPPARRSIVLPMRS